MVRTDATTRHTGEGAESLQLEGWIAEQIEGPPVAAPAAPRWPGRGGAKPSEPGPAWRQLRVEHRGSIAWVRFHADRLVKDAILAEVEAELGQLADACAPFLVLDFGGVERVSTQLLPILAVLQRRCEIERPGQLKLCRIGADLAEALGLTGLGAAFSVTADPASALAGPWPNAARALPVDVLGELARETARAPEPAPPPAATSLRLLVRHDADGRAAALSVGESGLLIGREAGCRVRVASPAVSRRHARVEIAGDHVRLTDLGSTNGTTIGSRIVRAETADLRDGDRFRIGPLIFEVAIGPRALVDSIVAEWSADGPADGGPTSFDQPVATTTDDSGRVVRERWVEGVSVLTPLLTRLDDEPAIERLRGSLNEPLERPEPTLRLVVNLAPLGQLPSRAVGLLLAHHLRLRRLGGELRLAGAGPNVAASLAAIRLTELVACYPSVDEAVIDRWGT